MTRVYKQQEIRHRSPKKIKKTIYVKTGPKKEKFAFKEKVNAIVDGDGAYIAKIK
jgi:hypothetical protein